jgi:hypothetical protein
VHISECYKCLCCFCLACSSDLKHAADEAPEIYVHNICLLKFGSYHNWMAFLSVDEYLVLQHQEATRRLPDFLAAYNDFGGLAVNVRVFGSSGFKIQPKGSILHNYIK